MFFFDLRHLLRRGRRSPARRSRACARAVVGAFDLVRHQPVAVCGAVGLVADHALGEQAGERLVEVEIAAALQRAREEARVEQMQDRVLDAADILVDRQPVVDRRRGRTARRRAASRSAAKYQDESTKVSSVSVSRRAGPPQAGQATCFQVGWCSSGLPGLSKSTSSGSTTGSWSSGTGTMPQPSQWMTGIGQPQ